MEGVGQFLQHKLGKLYPIEWGGFNACIVPIPSLKKEKKYVIVTRVFLTHDMLFYHKVIPGSKKSKDATATSLQHMRSHDWSTFFPWGNWENGIEMSVMFIAQVHSDIGRGIEIDTSYMPFIISGCTSKFQRHPYAYKQAAELGIPSMFVTRSHQLTCSDFRVFTLGNDIIMHDAYTNFLFKVHIDKRTKQIRYEPWVKSVCKLPKRTPPSGYRNRIIHDAPYYKYFDKNWSYIGKTNSGEMMFLDWFYEDGVHAVSMHPETGYCTRNRIVQFGKDIIPKDANELYPDFSFGSTTMSIAGTKSTHIDVIGVGHVKFPWKYIHETTSKLYTAVAGIDALFDQTYRKKYIRHTKYVYAAYFYRVKQVSQDPTPMFQMTMSDLWIPMFQKEKHRYHSLVFFPMSVTQSLDNREMFHVSTGVTDFYNVVLTFDKKSVLKKLVHDVSNMTMSNLNIDLIMYT
jgi:hypothetical protein